MKRISIYLTVIIILFLNILPAYADSLNLEPQSSYILIDSKTGQVLFEKDANKKLYPASTTKIMTAILAIEMGNMDQVMTASKAAVYDIGVDGMNIGIQPGEELRLEDLLNALLIKSANETANIIAENLCPTRKDFVALMNNKARELGATNTNFVNPCGAHDPNHYTTASDMSKIARYAMTLPKFREIVAKKEYSMPPTNKHPKWDTVLYTTNKLYESRFKSNYFTKVLGMKTGYTSQAGNNFISCAANDDGMELIGVVMDVNSPVPDKAFYNSKDLLDYGFKNFSLQKLADESQLVKTVQVANAASNATVDLVFSNSISAVLPTDKNNWNIETKEFISPYIAAPIKQGETLGWIEYVRNGVSLGKADIIASSPVPRVGKAPASRSTQAQKKFSINPLFKNLAITVLIILLVFVALRQILRRVSRFANTNRQEE